MLRILLVDDDTNLRDALEAVIVAAGHDVVPAGNGLEALAAAVTCPPQVIVSDVHMPVLEGPEMLHILRAVPQFLQVPVVLMSGVQATAGIFADRLLRKPFEPATLLESISSLVESTDDPSLEVSLAPTPFPIGSGLHAEVPAAATECAAHIRRGLQLIGEQETHLDELRRRRINTSVAQQEYDALVGCVIALARLETAAMATEVFPGLPSLRQRLPRPRAQ